MEILQHFELESLIKLLVAAVLGAAVGLERGTHGRPAGLRTHALVSMASTLLIVVSRTGAISGLSGPDNFLLNVDPARMAAGIVTGIGFIGAGAILRIRDSLVRGLTTAACIWFVAAVGVAVGVGAYGLGVVATVVALIILSLLDRLEGAMGSVVYRKLVIEAHSTDRQQIETSCRELFKQHRIRVQETNYFIDNKDDQAKLSFFVRISAKHEKIDLVSKVAALPGVSRVIWS